MKINENERLLSFPFFCFFGIETFQSLTRENKNSLSFRLVAAHLAG